MQHRLQIFVPSKQQLTASFVVSTDKNSNECKLMAPTNTYIQQLVINLSVGDNTML